MCAEPLLSGPTVIAYADTLDPCKFRIWTPSADATIWVNKVKNPQAYGVVELNNKGDISATRRKTRELKCQILAVIGIYYFQGSSRLKKWVDGCFAGKPHSRGGIPNQWWDFAHDSKRESDSPPPKSPIGWTVEIPVITIRNQPTHACKLLADEGETLVGEHTPTINSTIIPPCYHCGRRCFTQQYGWPLCVNWPRDTRIENSTIENSIIQSESELKQCHAQRFHDWKPCQIQRVIFLRCQFGRFFRTKIVEDAHGYCFLELILLEHQ